jgi:hypothetical protein
MNDCVTNEFTELTNLERVRYFPRQLITAEDLRQEQEYFIEKLRRHNRFLHGWGIVCGLTVKPAATTDLPWNILICPGYALGPYGDEIYLAKEYKLDIKKCLDQSATVSPCVPKETVSVGTAATTDNQIFIVIKYSECKTRPQKVMPAGCGCDETACEYSRVRDGYEIKCLRKLPESHAPTIANVIKLEKEAKKNGICPPCPKDPWLVLAQVTLPDNLTDTIDAGNIDTSTYRKKLII